MKIVIIPGFMGHPKEKVFEDLVPALKEKGHDVTIIAWPNFPDNLPEYNFTNTLNYVRDVLKDIEGEELIILGFSMGGILATILATEFKPKKLGLTITPYQAGTDDDLEGKYAQWKKSGKRMIKSSVYGELDIPFSFIEDARKYNALDYIDKVTCPKLFLVAENDEKVSRKASEMLYKKAKDPKQWWIIPGAQHRYQYQEKEVLQIADKIIVDFVESKT